MQMRLCERNGGRECVQLDERELCDLLTLLFYRGATPTTYDTRFPVSQNFYDIDDYAKMVYEIEKLVPWLGQNELLAYHRQQTGNFWRKTATMASKYYSNT